MGHSHSRPSLLIPLFHQGVAGQGQQRKHGVDKKEGHSTDACCDSYVKIKRRGYIKFKKEDNEKERRGAEHLPRRQSTSTRDPERREQERRNTLCELPLVLRSLISGEYFLLFCFPQCLSPCLAAINAHGAPPRFLRVTPNTRFGLPLSAGVSMRA
jgi:hypothetical protein